AGNGGVAGRFGEGACSGARVGIGWDRRMKAKLRAGFPGVTLALVLAAAVFSGVAALRAQRVVEVKGFRAAEPFDPPNEAKMKSLLEGASARPLSNGVTLVRDTKLQTFRETGAAEMIVGAPECLHDQ